MNIISRFNSYKTFAITQNKLKTRDPNIKIMDIEDQNNKKVDIFKFEVIEQNLAYLYIKKDDIVLELGARYGSVSCIINHNLDNKENHVVVEPDERVWEALERNKEVNNCKFNIVKGFISKKKLALTNLDEWFGGYGATAVEQNNTKIPSFLLDEIKKKYNMKFNVIVADCEGFLEIFFDENPELYNELRMCIFEADYVDKCNYTKIRNKLRESGFEEILGGHQNVWIRN